MEHDRAVTGHTCGTCGDKNCTSANRNPGESDEEFAQRQKLESRMRRVKHKIVVLSGKGGVGKSTVAVNLAVTLMMSGRRVGLLDVDIHGPSIPTMLGLEGTIAQAQGEEVMPVDVDGLKVLSMGFFLPNQDDAVIWRGPLKMGMIRQFLQDVAWGDLDFLIIDSPPGTGDEPLSVCQLIGRMDGAVIVTTPQRVAAVDVRKSITFCRKLGVPILGIIENMSGFVCPSCGAATPIFLSGGGRRIAQDMDVPFLGSIPIDPQIAEACDNGRSFIRDYAASPTAAIMRKITEPIQALDTGRVPDDTTGKQNLKEDQNMRIAIPLAEGKLAMHFGHCAHFALVDVEPTEKKVTKREDIAAPPHEPGLLPGWLAQRGVSVVIAGGMGHRAQELFAEHGIQVMVGAPAETPERLVGDYLAGTLKVGANICDH